MFVLRTVCFLVVLHVVFRPICGEIKQNATELPVASTKNVENIATTEKSPSSTTKIISEGGLLSSEAKSTEAKSTTQISIVKPVLEVKPIVEHDKEEEIGNTLVKKDNATEINTTNTHTTVPKKGVSLHDIPTKSDNLTSTTTEKLTTAHVKPKKPTVTVGSDDETEIDQKNKNSSTEKVPTIEYYQRNKEQIKKADFVIPIIAVILSVPIVAIVMNILYKRGKEWWSHRHYRRMDFLIDGMYNN